jgi:hypothetical protein
LTILEADFYETDLTGPFDVISYWNGFGIGSDADQRRLLDRIAHDWLAPDGCVLMDVFSPWQWARAAGTEKRNEESELMQRSDFDPVACRFIDQWWSLKNPVTSSHSLFGVTHRWICCCFFKTHSLSCRGGKSMEKNLAHKCSSIA